MATSDNTTNHEPEPERQVRRPDYIKVAKAFEARLAEAPDDDAVLDTLRRTLEVYEAEIRGYPRERLVTLIFPDRLALAARLAGAFKPRARGELGDLMAELIQDFAALELDVQRRIESVRRGTLPDGVESALLNVRSCTHILWTLMGETSDARAPTAEERDLNSSIDYAVEQLREHVRVLSRAVYGFDDDGDDDDGGENMAA